MQRHAVASYPEECCGLLLGPTEGGCRFVRESRETQSIAADSRQNRYRIAPLDLLDAENFVRRRRWEVIGVYHSHPDHPALPSEFDREHAIFNYSYIILSVVKGRVTELSCWSLRDWDSPFYPEELRILSQ